MGADDCQRVPGLKCLLFRKVGKANMEHFEDLRRRLFGALPHEFSAYCGILTFPNGSRIIAGHFQNEKDIDAYLGLEYHIIGIEEATTLSHRKYQDITTCCRTSKPNWRPRIYSTTNLGGIGHAWYKRMFVDPYLARQRALREGLIVVVLVVGILLIKAAVLLLLCMLFRKRAGTSVRTALLCAQCGEFAFVLMALSQRFGIIAEEGASIGVLTVSVTMALTPLLAKLGDFWGRQAERSETVPRPPASLEEPPEPLVIVGGFGRCGEAVGAFLREKQIPFRALDLDWDRVLTGRQRGYPVSVGDITDYTVLRNAGAARCRLLVIASNDAATAGRAILALRLIAPALTPIAVRVKDRAQAEKLKAAGASHLVVEYDEIGQRLIDSVSSALDTVDASGSRAKI